MQSDALNNLVSQIYERIKAIIEDNLKSLDEDIFESSNSKQNKYDVISELWLFYSHITDRMLFKYLGPMGRDFVMDRLSIQIALLLFKDDKERGARFYGKCAKLS